MRAGSDAVSQDVRDAARTLRRRPGFAAAAILMLALGIGATTAIFTVVKAVLIDPLLYPDAGRLVRIAHTIGGIDQTYFNDAIFLTYAENSRAFASVGVWTPEGAGVTITGGGEPEQARALFASRGLFTTLGVAPQLGQLFSAEEDAPGSPNTAMIGAGYWRRKLAADAGVVGRTIVVDGRPHTIVGVMPAHFSFGGESEIFLPLRINPARPVPFFRLNGVARLYPGVTLAAAGADVPRILAIYFDRFKTNTDRSVRWTPLLTPLKQDVIGDVGPTLWILMAHHRPGPADGQRERRDAAAGAHRVAAPGVRDSRGARRMVVAPGPVAAGREPVARRDRRRHRSGGCRGWTAAAPARRTGEPAEAGGDLRSIPRSSSLRRPSPWSCGLAVRRISIGKYFGGRFTAAAGIDTRAATVTRDGHRSQQALVALQMALALVLLVSSGLMIRSFQALRGIDPGSRSRTSVEGFTITIPASVGPTWSA